MSVSYEDFLNSAEDLLKDTASTEIDFRNLVSRSYYAVFLLAREKSKNLPVPPNVDMKKLGSHERVIVKFEKHTKLNRIGHLMVQLKLKRCVADYDIHLDIKKVESAQHFYHSKGLIAKLENLKDNLNPTV